MLFFKIEENRISFKKKKNVPRLNSDKAEIVAIGSDRIVNTLEYLFIYVFCLVH